MILVTPLCLWLAGLHFFSFFAFAPLVDVGALRSGLPPLSVNGRGTQYPVSLEGALKEVSYTYTDVYAAGELKHDSLDD